MTTLSIFALAACSSQKSNSDMKRWMTTSMMKKRGYEKKDDMKKEDMKDSSIW